MANLWDIPPIPNRGDITKEETLLSVGIVMSEWESLEFELSRLHTWLSGHLDHQGVMREYAEPRTFSGRTKILAKSASNYFISHCDQATEGAFDKIIERALKYADRRNDIAHGVVFRIDELTFFKSKLKSKHLNRKNYALIPPLHAFRKIDAKGFPSYAYTSREMNRISRRIYNLRKESERFRVDQSGEEFSSGGPEPLT